MKSALSATLVCATAVFSCLSGCASTTENLRLETARFLGGNVSPGQVTVTAIDRGASSVKWAAATPDGNYACGADDMVRRVSCVKQ
jgi:hypothetical protein